MVLHEVYPQFLRPFPRLHVGDLPGAGHPGEYEHTIAFGRITIILQTVGKVSMSIKRATSTQVPRTTRTSMATVVMMLIIGVITGSAAASAPLTLSKTYATKDARSAIRRVQPTAQKIKVSCRTITRTRAHCTVSWALHKVSYTGTITLVRTATSAHVTDTYTVTATGRRTGHRTKQVRKRGQLVTLTPAASAPTTKPIVQPPAPVIPTPTPTPAPAPVPTPVAPTTPPKPGDSRDNPIPLGTIGSAGDWAISVSDIVPDAWSTLAFYNHIPSEVPPPAGMNYFMVQIKATYIGTAPDSFFHGIHATTVGPSSAVYELWDHPDQLPDGLDDRALVTPGHSETGRICWIVQTTDVGDLVMAVDPGWDSGKRVYFAL